MKRRLLYLLLLSVIGCGSLRAQFTCETAMPVDTAFAATIPYNGTYWFSAWTYDLPVSVNFAPSTPNSTATPSALLDFTCDPGVYEDSILNRLFNGDPASGVSVTIEMPKSLKFDSLIVDGQKVYNITIGKNYRDVFSVVGIHDPVQAFVKVTFPEVGNLSMVPDTMFRDCQSHSQKVVLGDTLAVAPNDTDKVYIFPYSEWKNDSIRYLWRGSKPLRIWLAHTDCNYNLNTADPNVWDVYDLESQDTLKLTAAEVENTMVDTVGGGIFYVRLQSDGAGRLIVEKVPEKEHEPGTILLQYNHALNLAANDTGKVFYITRDAWQRSVVFSSSANKRMHMFVSTTGAAKLSAADARVLAVYDFDEADAGFSMALIEKEMKTLWNRTDDDYLYLRFMCAAASSVRAALWSPSVCENKTNTRLYMGVPVAVANGSSSILYRLRYADFGGDTLAVAWTGTNTLQVYIGDTCVFANNPSNIHVSQRYRSIAAGGNAVFTSSETSAWAGKTDVDGWMYVKFNPKSAGNVTLTTTKVYQEPQDETPEQPEQPVDPENPEPITPPDFLPEATVSCNCSELDMQFFVTEEQDLRLYDQFGHLVDSWHQAPSDPPHTYTPVCGVQYVLKGKQNTVRIVR